MQAGRTEKDILKLNAAQIFRYSSMPERVQLGLLEALLRTDPKEQTSTISLLSFTSRYEAVQRELLKAAAPVMASEFSGWEVRRHFSCLRLSALRINPNLFEGVRQGLDALDAEFRANSPSVKIRWNGQMTGVEYATVQKNFEGEMFWIKTGSNYSRFPDGTPTKLTIYIYTTKLPSRI